MQGGSQCCAFKGRSKKKSRSAAHAQFRCSRHSELSGEPRRKEGRERENHAIFPGNRFPTHSAFTPHVAITVDDNYACSFSAMKRVWLQRDDRLTEELADVGRGTLAALNGVKRRASDALNNSRLHPRYFRI